jgi:hypothetical protein
LKAKNWNKRKKRNLKRLSLEYKMEAVIKEYNPPKRAFATTSIL